MQRAEQVIPFEYRPLKLDREIRLLQIDKQPAGFLSNFKCKLVHAQLGDQSYPYNAASYTWGNPNPTSLLIVDNDQCLRVTKNVGLLVDFLFRGMSFGTCFFWVDAVCINQADLEEKSSQVSLMRDIYQHACMVIIWLGEPEGSYEEEAIEDLQKLGKFFKLYEKNNDKYGATMTNRAKQDSQSNVGHSGTVWMKEVSPDGRVRMRRPAPADMSQRHMTPAMIEARFRLHYGKELRTDWNWGCISMLLSKPWFERVWVIQEAFAGPRVVVHCGTKVMLWEDFNFVASQLVQCGLDASIHHGTVESDGTLIRTVPTGITNTVFIHFLKLAKGEKKPLRLAPLLLISSRYQATNPRDKVYALLGISSEGKHSDLVPNYSLPVEEVFVKTAVHLILQDESLEILAAAGIGWHRETPNLPSWVPDFKHLPELPRWRFDVCSNSFAASTDEDKSNWTAKFIPKTNNLIVSGILIDEVTWVGPLPCPQSQVAKAGGAATYILDSNSDHTSWFSQTTFMCRSLNKYPTNEPLDEVFWRTLIMNSTDQGFFAVADYGTSFHRVEFGLGEAAKYSEAHKEERVDLAILMSELAHHEKQDTVSAELAYMQRVHQASNLELDRRWRQAYTANGAGRNALITRRGYFGIAAPGIKVGDRVALFAGLATPMILRVAKGSIWKAVRKAKQAYHLVSESYIHGLMSGGGLKWGDMQDICLC
jgi:Heterokaryon incompatibility protein (HET)